MADLQTTRIALIVPTYRRPDDLERCLRAVAAMERRPDQFLVIVREGDDATWTLLQRHRSMQPAPTVVLVQVPGVVAALNAGLARAEADIIAFTDDDAAPRPDWLRRVEACFALDPAIGGVGGRDWIVQHGRMEPGAARCVGRLTWFGRCIGQHHLGVGPVREVDILKGVNMAFRAQAIAGVRFDERLRGSGAQVGNELGISLAVKRRRWKLVYDPQIAVDHFPSVRHDEDRRNTFSTEAISNAAFNETLLICEHFPRWRRAIFLGWAWMLGNHAAPGLLQWCRLVLTSPQMASARLRATWCGRLAGWRAAC